MEGILPQVLTNTEFHLESTQDSYDCSMSIFKEHKTNADRVASDRRRHKEKIDKAIREGIHHIVADESIIGQNGKQKFRIPVRGIKEHRFVYGDNGKQVGSAPDKDVCRGQKLGGKDKGKKPPPHSPKTLRKMFESMKGKNTGPQSEEHRRKLSEARKKWRLTDEQKAAIKANKKPVSEKTRQKLSKAGKGRIVSDETRRKMSESQKGFRDLHLSR